MRKFIFLTLTFFFFCSVNAQFKIGGAAGVSLASRSGYNKGLNYAPVTEFQVNMFAKQPLGKKFIVYSELGYIGKGVQFKDWWFMDNLGNDEGRGNMKIRFDYIELKTPILFDFSFITKAISDEGELFTGLGPYIANAFNGHSSVTKFTSAN